jgi:hypothetical protein
MRARSLSVKVGAAGRLRIKRNATPKASNNKANGPNHNNQVTGLTSGL